MHGFNRLNPRRELRRRRPPRRSCRARSHCQAYGSSVALASLLLASPHHSAVAVTDGYREPNPEILRKAESIAASLKPVTPKQTRRVLIYGISFGPHRMVIRTSRRVLELLGEKTGAFEAVVSEDLANFERDRLRQFDAVVFANTTGEVFCRPADKAAFQALGAEEQVKQKQNAARLAKNLDDFIRAGGGFVGIHAATDTLKSQTTYTEMIGGVFWGHPWGGRDTVVLQVEDPGHALTEGVFEANEFEFQDEIYEFREPYSRDRLHVLMSLNLEKSDKPGKPLKRKDGDYPVAWVRSHGKGRVFYCSLGHSHLTFAQPSILAFWLRGTQFATGDIEVQGFGDVVPPNEAQPAARPLKAGAVGPMSISIKQRLVDSHTEAFQTLDEKVRDPFILRGPDGLFYLTGTTAGTHWGETIGIRLWRSRDLATSEDLCVVWDLHQDGEVTHLEPRSKRCVRNSSMAALASSIEG